jgi:hypothetical protein
VDGVEIREPVVRIRCPSPGDEARCRAVLEKAGLAAEPQLTWLAVRDADPDAVNELLVEAGVAGRVAVREADPDRVNDLLVAGGALGRVVVREQIGKLVGFVLDHGPELGARAGSLRANVARLLATAGLSSRWTPLPEGEMAAAGALLHGHLMETRGGFVSWERFTRLFCRSASPA